MRERAEGKKYGGKHERTDAVLSGRSGDAFFKHERSHMAGRKVEKP